MITLLLLLLVLFGAPLGEARLTEYFIDSKECKIFCRTAGKGKPLVVLHGGPGSGQDYLLPQLYALAENNFVIFYDQRGAGSSTGEINEDTMAMSQFISDLEAIRHAFNFEKISLLGHSWGAFVAMHYAAAYPNYVEKLILSNPCPASSTDFSLFTEERAHRLSEVQEEVMRIQDMSEYQEGDPDLYEQVLRHYVRAYCHTPKNADLLNLRLCRQAIINAIKIQKIIFENILNHFDLHPSLATLHIPTLVIHGADDPIPLSTVQHIHESICGSTYIVLDKCGHYPYIEQPELYFKTINEFLIDSKELPKMKNYLYDSNHVRYELYQTHEGKPYNWLFFPGGPGVDSSYLRSLVDELQLPGNVWLIDLPGNGSNVWEGYSEDFDQWVNIFPEIIKQFDNPVLVGHSFGGMFPLLFPQLESYLKGFVILNSAPSLWLEEAVAYSKQFDLPDLSKEMQEFTVNPNPETFRTALNACMPYYFPQNTLEKGRELLSQVDFPYAPAVWWQRKAIESNFSAKWVPQKVPTLIIGSKYDCICPFTLFQKDKRFQRSNIELLFIEDAGHMIWVENPAKAKEAFEKIIQLLK